MLVFPQGFLKKSAIFDPLEIPNCRLWLDSNDLATLTIDGLNGISNWSDKSGAGHNVVQDIEANRPIYSNGEVSFNGSTTFMELASNIGITTYPFTVSCWIKMQIVNSRPFLSLNTIGNSTRYAYIGSESGRFTVVNRNTTFNPANGTTSFVVGTWYYITGVFTNSTSRRLYVNGIEENHQTSTVSFPTFNNIYLGRTRSTDSILLNGVFSKDILIYAESLSPEQINQLMSR
jgi:hypothetical protein